MIPRPAKAAAPDSRRSTGAGVLANLHLHSFTFESRPGHSRASCARDHRLRASRDPRGTCADGTLDDGVLALAGTHPARS
jgi:hypothetical protein